MEGSVTQVNLLEPKSRNKLLVSSHYPIIPMIMWDNHTIFSTCVFFLNLYPDRNHHLFRHICSRRHSLMQMMEERALHAIDGNGYVDADRRMPARIARWSYSCWRASRKFCRRSSRCSRCRSRSSRRAGELPRGSARAKQRFPSAHTALRCFQAERKRTKCRAAIAKAKSVHIHAH